MDQYTVKTGQNIFDVAVTIYGGIEGLFDLLVCNEGLSVDTRLKRGQVLNCHKAYSVDGAVKEWAGAVSPHVANGEPEGRQGSVQEQIVELGGPADATPVLLLACGSGDVSLFVSPLFSHSYIDWGDMTGVEECAKGWTIHRYDNGATHNVVVYGARRFAGLDLSKVRGFVYPLCNINADNYTGPDSPLIFALHKSIMSDADLSKIEKELNDEKVFKGDIQRVPA